MSLKLYFDALSQPSRALLMFVRKTKIPCQEVTIALRKGENRTDEYAKINRFQKVPAITHNNFNLAESEAIFRYLCLNFNVDNHWYPKNDSNKMARIDEYMSWQHLNIRAFGSMLFVQSFIKPLLTGEPSKPKSIERAENDLVKILDLFENVWLKENPYIVGNEISIADLMATTELEQPKIVGFDITKGRPNLQKYMDRVKSDMNPIYDDVHSMAYKIGQKFAEKGISGILASMK